MNIQARDRQRGFSLAEILTAVAVFAIVMIAALLVYDRSNKIFKQGVESSNLQQNTRVAFGKLVSDLRIAGFDFDRDGIPTISGSGTNQYQQPDEQFEYIGPAALTFRANLDYDRESAPCSGSVTDNCDNGREKGFENTYFPLVTTGNDEIVTYALVPDSQTTIPACDGTTNCIEFFADVARPRRSYPEPSNGGQNESLVQIPGVDLCNGGCNNPPYTLYRFSLDRAATNFANGANVLRTPLASNIRSLSFEYFQDAQGQEALKDLPNENDVDAATIRGLGQFAVANPSALVTEREIRTKIRSIRVVLTGMNENADANWTQTTGTDAAVDTAAENYRQYRLETLVAPRNMQRRGMREQDVNPPGSPTIRSICTGHCGGVYVDWDAPAATGSFGAPDQYKIIYGPSAGSGYPCETTTFTQTFTHLFGTGPCALSPNVSYRLAVVALNSYGSNASPDSAPFTPLNATKPNPPQLVSVSSNLNGEIRLVWNRPTANASGSVSCGPTHIPPAEIRGYLIERAQADTEPPANSVLWQPVNPSGTPQVTVGSPYDTVTWTDDTVSNCLIYWYRVRTREFCNADNAYNVGNNAALGESAVSTAVRGTAVSTDAPKTPADFTVDTLLYDCDPSDATMCSARMSWPKVVADVNDNEITVGQYNIYRRLRGSSGAWTLAGSQTTIPAGDTVTWQSPRLSVASNTQYEFTMAAVQCVTLESARFTPVRIWPCDFPTGIVGSPMLEATAFDGTGTAANPWLFFNTNDTATVAIDVVDATKIQTAVGRVYNADGSLKTTLTATSPNWNFSWNMANNTTERIDVTVVETGGCSRIESAYVGDMPQGCCLTPRSSDGTVVNFTAATKTVEIFFKNVCGTALTLQDLAINWTKIGGQKLETVQFIPASGTTTMFDVPNSDEGDETLAVTIPSGTAVVPADSTSYKIRLNFANTNALNPVTAVNVEYRRSGIDTTDQACPVVP